MILSAPPRRGRAPYGTPHVIFEWLNRRRVLLTLLLGFAFLSAVGGAFALGVLMKTRLEFQAAKFLYDKGYELSSLQFGMRGPIGRLGRFLRRRFIYRLERPSTPADPLPVLTLDVKFKHLQKIFLKRQEAMQRGILVKGEDDFIPAMAKSNGRMVRIKMRLKGDWTDHLESNKWSYRIEVKDGDQLFGMRVFSIQHPKTRKYIREMLAFEHMKENGVLTPRYFFIKVFLNGDDLGIYAVEENFSKELLEARGYREGPIIRPDETQYWEHMNTPMLPLFHPRASMISPFKPGKIRKSEDLLRQTSQAVGLLRAHFEEALPTDRVFNVEQLATMFAVAELWDANHIDPRYYYNPIEARLLPIAFDLDPPGRHEPSEAPLLNLNRSGFLTKTFRVDDPAFGPIFFKKLHQVAKQALSTEWLARHRELEVRKMGELDGEFPLLEPYDWEGLRRRARMLLRTNFQNGGKFSRVADPGDDLPFKKIINAYVTERNGKLTLELMNLLSHGVEIVEVTYTKGTTRGIIPVRVAALPPRHITEAPKPVYVDLSPINEEGIDQISFFRHAHIDIVVRAKIPGREEVWVEKALPYFATLVRHPLDGPNLAGILRRYEFLRRAPGRDALRIVRGDWKIDEFLILPEGYSLHIEAGTTLRFAKNAGLLVNGSIRAQGTTSEMITFTSQQAEGWRGLAVINAASESLLSHTAFLNTTGVANGNWSLTGGVNFYKGRVTFERCIFSQSSAEDALNVISAEFKLSGSTFENTRSDAFDGDFAKGVIRDSSFRNIGGDGIDFSGSEVDVEGSRFHKIYDKAVSVGERSSLRGRNLVVEGAGTGVVSKDGSFAEIVDSSFQRIVHVAMMAYIKKREFGPGKLVSRNNRFETLRTAFLNQTGNELIVNGRIVEGRPFDVDKLYAGYMKK